MHPCKACVRRKLQKLSLFLDPAIKMDIREGTIQCRLLACAALKLIVVMARVVTVCRGQSGTIFKKGGGGELVRCDDA